MPPPSDLTLESRMARVETIAESHERELSGLWQGVDALRNEFTGVRRDISEIKARIAYVVGGGAIIAIVFNAAVVYLSTRGTH